MGQRDVNRQDESSLAERLRERIRRAGAISFRDWMQAALYDEREGYYCRKDLQRWGRAGDYRTSPERSPLFAATFARYFAELYAELGAPKLLWIIEAGAGAGHFAEGVLETLRRWYPQVFAATRYLFDEASEDARQRAKPRLAPFAERVEFRRFYEIETASVEGIIFANELLDAFPVHRVRMRDGKLLELYVGLDDTGAFRWVEGEPGTSRLQDISRASASISLKGRRRRSIWKRKIGSHAPQTHSSAVISSRLITARRPRSFIKPHIVVREHCALSIVINSRTIRLRFRASMT